MPVTPLLTLAFSTMGSRLPDLIPLLKTLRHDACELLVVVQRGDDCQPLVADLPQVRFIWSQEVGLSRSRNLAMEQAEGTFFWLLDDDVHIDSEHLIELCEHLRSLSQDISVLRVRVGCTEDRNAFYKTYSPSDVVSRLSLLQMNSIELILRREFVKRHGLSFNPNIGLGTDYPGGEEIHFLLDLFDAGGSIALIHKAFVYHSCTEGGRRKAENNAIMELRGATASRFGILGWALLVRWLIRYSIRDKRLGVATSLVKGFFRGYQAFRQ